jgi:4a-hydroxytetrahydrobiopterin dehydratase
MKRPVPLLNEEQIQEEMGDLPDWQRDGGTLKRTYTTRNFLHGLDFLNRVAPEAEALNHHPDVSLHYKRVVITLTTHDSGGLTELDFQLAARMEAAWNR